ncbi:hypothetical protein [Larkinella soli]|uniref:hypothetical protein n=1 Tax=Larkinella soli TaxID=1770527 RepID=UPI000FFB5837|nr:hypothetical protein [Larkinella soli]
MNTGVNWEELIKEGIKGLPERYLSEVADFVVFIRRKALSREDYNLDEIRKELSQLDTRERQHLEDEFENFDQQFPKE